MLSLYLFLLPVWSFDLLSRGVVVNVRFDISDVSLLVCLLVHSVDLCVCVVSVFH